MAVKANEREQTRLDPSSSAFAGNVTRKLRAQGIAVARARGKADENADLYIVSHNERHCGLPTCMVSLTAEALAKPQPRKGNGHRVPHTARWAKLLTELGYCVVDSYGGVLIIAAREVRVIDVPSSERDKPDYNVRVENGEPVMCGCKGFAYRLHCRHLAVARSLAAKQKKVS